MQKYTSLHRLKKADEFSSVFIFRKIKSGKYIKIYFKPNSDIMHSRLGLIVSKKIHKKSNKRFYMKRVLRELFRINQPYWDNYDIIIKVSRLFVHDDFKLVSQEFHTITKQFIKTNANI